ncbi:uncharacterized protein EKO05_0004308 [Ascochyta rabiei]|uniref:Oxidoreductase n=1 Tax=Didymella rabiei TaxID=5454 RepID=A0A162XUU6_DIDRA|nr:uncharacterized protein EKO05_0004308 [Ascochyta rabiei]KZM19695.1 oxidoreductase [Ascochyta rabiei]UPX13809.1 hypothetical protein EKO05_0004308 [Ascochyta rabiei]
MSRTILITGASSGLGLAFLKHYTSQDGSSSIIALDASPLPVETHNALKSSNVTFVQTDVTSSHQICSLAAKLSNEPIDLLIHCAGVRGLVPEVVKEKRGDVAAAETMDVMDHSTFTRAFEVNTWGTFNVVTSFLPNLRLSPNAEVVILSSRMGSVSANKAGGGYAYRASKAALNAVVKSFVLDVPEATFLLLHPGRVETKLVDWKEEGAISPEESLQGCLKVMEGLTKEDSGRLVDRFGVDIPW